MGYTSKFKGSEIDALLEQVQKGGTGGGSGVPIVDSVDKLDTDAPAGSLAVVASGGTIEKHYLSECYQATEDDIDPDTHDYNYDVLSKINNLDIVAPTSVPSFEKQITIEIASPYSSGMNMIMLFIGWLDNKFAVVTNFEVDGEFTEELYLIVQEGDEFIANTEGINVLKEVLELKEWYYATAYTLHIGAQIPLTEEEFSIVNSIFSYSTGSPLEVNAYIKKQSWEVFSSGGGAATLMVETTWADLVALRDSEGLVAGQKYRIIDYETMTSKEGSQSAGHPFDIVVTALDSKTLDEKASAIQSARDTEGYFANSNLAAWDVRYCLDNDKSRFDWAAAKDKSIVVDLSTINAGLVTATLNGTFVYQDATYVRWDASVKGMEVYFLTPSEDVTIGSTPILYIVAQSQGTTIQGTITSVTINGNEGKGVIYRLIDENRNDIPYDFKNLQFIRKVTNGALDLESGTDTYCYTFSDFTTGALLDGSLLSSVYLNTFGNRSWNNVFFTAICYSNIFGYNCHSNTFGDNCYSNTFGGDCYSNTFGYNCHSNTFGYNCHSNTFGKLCQSNTFGEGCYSNTFGFHCFSNTFGDNCLANTFGEGCYCNTFGDYCQYNAFGDGCYFNTLGFYCQYNAFGTTEALLSNIIHYKVDCVSNTEIEAVANRDYVTYVTKNSAGEVVQYTIDDILNA